MDLRPDRDEQDQFQARAERTAVKKAKPARKSEKTAPPEVAPSNSKALPVGLFALSLVLFGFLGWAFIKQSETMQVMEGQLSEATAYISQTKLEMARFEGELSEADAEMAESGSEIAKKLKFLDSEMRKLWGVAGDRNKAAIGGNKDAIAGLKVQLKKLKDKELGALSQVIESQKASITALTKEVEVLSASSAKIAQMEKQLALTSSELALTRESVEGELSTLSKKLKAVPDSGKGVEENTKAIASIDASRRQVNDRLIKLERTVNELKLALSASKSPSASQN